MKECASDITLMLEGSTLASKPLVKSQKEGALGNVCAHKSLHTGDIYTRGPKTTCYIPGRLQQWETSKEQYMDASGD